ncbi:MAG TPA: cytochrome c [Gemmataceae bacterium]|jgi:hypothetical protein|nr:cytochrome c [Gemmataceae bacterium]
MRQTTCLWRRIFAASGLCSLLAAGILWTTTAAPDARAGIFHWRCGHGCDGAACGCGDGADVGELGGTWYWLRSPEEEKRVIASLYNRYCIRCHGVDGRGVWDIPDVPDFTNAVWQASRSDGELAHLILEGRGAVMPPFRGTLTLEESWAMARYLRSLVPGTETPRPDLSQPKKTTTATKVPQPPAPAVLPGQPITDGIVRIPPGR